VQVISVNVGLPREVIWKGVTVQTGIFKDPVDRSVKIKKLNLAGDQQADLTVHGGAEKAVTRIRPSTTSTGGRSCRTCRSRGASSVRTSRPKG
jgi:MOSC domain-containing protein YiiM